MRRIAPLVVTAGLLVACSGTAAGLLQGDLNSGAHLDLDADATEASGSLLAFDPAQHRMMIEIAIKPVEHPDDIDILIVTEAGSRYQILSSFHRCVVEETARICDRRLPAMPGETVGDWQVVASRQNPTLAATVDVKVDWIKLDG